MNSNKREKITEYNKSKDRMISVSEKYYDRQSEDTTND
jgi:hypothetical protein